MNELGGGYIYGNLNLKQSTPRTIFESNCTKILVTKCNWLQIQILIFI